MKKIEKELMEKKFEKLSGINKIRYNLGNIIFNQMRMYLFIGFIGLAILGYLLVFPFVIRYFSFSRIILMAIGGVLVFLFAIILFFVGMCKLDKFEKALGDFLKRKSKK